jgi:hypothetical protein
VSTTRKKAVLAAMRKAIPAVLFSVLLILSGCGGGGAVSTTDWRDHPPQITELKVKDTLTGTVQKGFGFTLIPDYDYIMTMKVFDTAGDVAKAITVYRDWMTIGGSDGGQEQLTFYDNGMNGDARTGDGIYTLAWKSENYNSPTKIANVITVKDLAYSRSNEFSFTFSYTVNQETSHPF